RRTSRPSCRRKLRASMIPATRPSPCGSKAQREADAGPAVPARTAVAPSTIAERRAHRSFAETARTLMASSVPIPKFASLRGILVYELRNRQDTSGYFPKFVKLAAPPFTNFGTSWALANILILVPVFHLKFLDRIRRFGGASKSMIPVWLLAQTSA